MLSRILIFALFLAAMNVFAQTPTIETGVPQTLARWRSANYSDVRYKLNFTLEKMSPVLKGTIEISLKNNADQIVLDWRKIRGKEDTSRIENVFINGKSAKFDEINEHLVFKEGVKAGENVIKLDFTSPILTSGSAITRYVDKEDNAEYVYSLFVPSDASTAFPVFDQPDLKARFKLSVNIGGERRRPYWRAISNTKPEMVFNTTWNTFYLFEETKPISTYVFAFAVGEFEEFIDGNNEPTSKLPKEWWTQDNLNEYNTHKKPRIYVRKSQAEKFKQHAAETFRLNREAVKYLESYFDYKFPFPKYDLVLLPEFPFGGMEHAGATFLREDRVIFPTEPTKNDFVTRANLIFHEAAHQWFGDTVTMRWFDDLWLKEGFAEFMAYKTLEKVMPEYNAWKIFYERNKQAAYLTDSTKGTTPIYQEIPNLASAKSAYGNIVYRKAPSFLKQAEFYLGADKFQTAVRAFLKKHQFANAEWTDLVKEFQTVSWSIEGYSYWKQLSAKEKKEIETRDKKQIRNWAEYWVRQPGVPTIRVELTEGHYEKSETDSKGKWLYSESWMVSALGLKLSAPFEDSPWALKIKTLYKYGTETEIQENLVSGNPYTGYLPRLFDKNKKYNRNHPLPDLIFPNYQDYGYGIFLLDEKSRAYVQKNIQNERDDFLRTMMWGSLWDSVREAELAPQDYVELVIKNINVETDESTIQTLIGRVSTTMSYYLSDAQRSELTPKIEAVLIEKMQKAETLGQRITFYRAFLNTASSENARMTLKQILKGEFSEQGGSLRVSKGGQILEKSTVTDKTNVQNGKSAPLLTRGLPPLKTKDKFDIVTRLLILGDKDAAQLLAELEKTETSDEAKRYAYAAKAGIATAESKAKFWNDFVNNKDISENWIEAAFVSFNPTRHSDLTLPYLEKALAELPNLKRTRKIFFVNGWLAAFIGGQRSEQALAIVNKFLADNPNLDKDLRLKILENSDGLERTVRIRAKHGS